MLRLIPDIAFPTTSPQINPLMDNVVQLNLLEAGLSERQQRALSLLFHIHDLWVKSRGKIDYRQPGGHARLMQDAATLIPASLVTKTGDLPAAHLALDYSDAQVRLRTARLPLLASDVHQLLFDCRDFCEVPPQTQKGLGLVLDLLSKKPL